MFAGVLHHLLHAVPHAATEPAEELETVVPVGPVALQVVHHHRPVWEQNVDTAQLAVDPETETREK